MPQILTSANLPNYASDPSSPSEGDVYFNTATNSVRIYVASTALGASRWVDLGGYQVQSFSAGSTTWTRPSNVSYLKWVFVAGAGGGGSHGEVVTVRGPSTATAYGAAGGGSGSWVYAENVYIGNQSTISVFVPTGGVGAGVNTFTKSAGQTTQASIGVQASGSNASTTTFGSYITAGSANGELAGGAYGALNPPTFTVYDFGNSAGANISNGNDGGGAGAPIDYNPGDPGFGFSTFRDAYPPQSGFSPTAGSATVVSGSSTGIVTMVGTSFAGGNVSAAASLSGARVGSGGGTGMSEMSTSGAGIGGSAGQGGGNGGGSAGSGVGVGISASAATSGVSVSITSGKGANGKPGCGGGASGSVALVAPAAQYDGLTISITVPAGGNGGDGIVYIAYVA
jgi:hypothetical protein